MGGDLYALDFDGVLCNSCGESSLSAVKAAKVRWPWVFEQVDATMEEWIVEQMYSWSLLHKDDGRTSLKNGCRILETVIMEMFTKFGWKFQNRIEA